VDKPSTSSHDGADENKSNNYKESEYFVQTIKLQPTKRVSRIK
jgi:hypothetical protein